MTQLADYLRRMIASSDEQYQRARAAMPAGHSSVAAAVARRDAYADALRVLEQLAADTAEREPRPPSSQEGHEPSTFTERSS